MKKIVQSPHFAEFNNLMHGFTTRELGADYDRLAVELKILSSQIYHLEQIHSDKVVYLNEGMDLSHLPHADALITQRKGVVIGVRTADCLPILIHDPEREVVAAVHAGHKGLLAGVIQNTLKIMTERIDCDSEDIFVLIGPAISVENYEVDQSLIDAFEKKYTNQVVFTKGQKLKPHFDLKATAKNILQDAGVDKLHISDLNLCTFERSDLFYSYRRGDRDVRQFSFIGMF